MRKQKQHLRWVRVAGLTFGTILLGLTATLCIYSCTKHSASAITGDDSAQPKLKTNTAQPLPGGRAYFTSAIGRFQTSTGTACWVRVVNYTFNASAGTVSAQLWGWSSTSEFGKTLFTSHTCSVEAGYTKTCSQYSPTGWIVGTATNPPSTWSGVYTYNTSTGALHISWPGVNNAYEDWTITASVGGKPFSEMVFVGSSSNYSISNGYGFGSSQPFTSYKTINQVPRVDMSGHLVGCTWDGSASNYTLTGSPQNQAFGSMGGVTGGNAIHMKLPTSPAACSAGCYSPATGHTGIIYHLTGNDNSRMVVYNHHCACLPNPTTYPCYSGTIHPYAMMEVIDDNGDMQGLIGIHEQDQPGSAGFGYSINYWLYP